MLKTFLLGIDGLPDWQWRKFADEGIMPYSKGLLDSGTLRPMQSAVPEVSSAAWASIVTGENPGGHNVYGFTDLMDGSYMLGFTSSRTIKATPFWNLKDGTQNLIMNVPQTYPAMPMNGHLVSGYVALDLDRAIFPSEELAMYQELGYRVDADMSAVEISKDKFVADVTHVMRTRVEALNAQWEKQDWDSIMFVITGTDRVNHYLWEDYEDPGTHHYQMYLDFYREVDSIIESIVSRLDDETSLIVVSDHGFERQRISVNVNTLLKEHGFLALRDKERASYIDMLPETRAFAMDPGRIYLHRESRYPNGSVADEDAEEVIAELSKALMDIEVEGKPLVSQILRGSDVYSGQFAHRAPDLILLGNPEIALSARMGTNELIEDTLINGKHTLENSTFFYRGTKSVQIPDKMRVEDVLGVMQQAEGSISKAA